MNANQNRCKGSKEGGSSTLEPPYKNVQLVHKSGRNECKGSATDQTRANQYCDERRIGIKRQFANRTRTGCRTCRRRKKKCDEAKPKCKNCLRGNFECAGYAKKIPWSNINAAKALPPLQSLERMPSAEVSAHFVRCAVCNIVHIPHCGPTQNFYVEPPSGIETSQDRPVSTDQRGRRPLTQSGWGKTCAKPQQLPSEHSSLPQPRPHSSPVNYHTLQIAPIRAPIQDRSPVHDYHASCLLPPIASMLAVPPASPLSQCMHPYFPLRSEKDKMLSGKPFLPNTEKDERKFPLGASFRFNNTVVQIGSSEREWHFKRIVTAECIYPRPVELQTTGHMGDGGINVFAPFHCDYGYNISIGDNVIIGPDCQLLDSGIIVIERNTKIGARVTISTLKEPTETRSLKGSKSTGTALGVYIGENVCIGDGCIIEAGVRIGYNAIVRAGSVVVRDIPADCLAFGNPAKARQIDREG